LYAPFNYLYKPLISAINNNRDKERKQRDTPSIIKEIQSRIVSLEREQVRSKKPEEMILID
jgi:hypothetical protein